MRILSWLWRKIQGLDPILFACTSFLSIFSIVIVYGAVDNFGKSKLVMQVAMALAGAVATVFVANINYRWLVKKAWLIMLLFSVGILAVTLLFGSSGATRDTSNKSWLTIPGIGIAIQPSEFVKITFICTFAYHLFRVRKSINNPLTLLGLAVHAGAVVGLILLSGDLGVAMVYIGFVLLMLFAAGMSVWYDVGLATALTAVFPYLYNNFFSDYQIKRIYYGFHPEEDPLDWGWQALFSRETIAHGEFFGRGIFGGSYYETLAASHTDFIFATVCEKTGFVGGLLVILALCGIVLRSLAIARDAGGEYGSLIAVGVAAVIIVQTAENVAMTLALVPVVGITLPFVSCGGSSMLATYLLVGLVHSVANTQKRLEA